MELKRSSNQGVALLYVIMALLAVSFIGVSLISAGRADVNSSAYYGGSETARLASQAGMTAGMNYFSSARKGTAAFDSLIARLSLFLNLDSIAEVPESARWLLGDEDEFIEIGSTDWDYRVYLEGIDKNSMTAQLRVDAKGQGQSYATNRGLYYLDGLVLDTIREYDTLQDTTFVPMAAFRLGGNTNFEVNGNVRVTGMTWLQGKLTNNSGTVIFDGKFCQEDGSYVNTFNGGSLTFTDTAYIGGHLDLSSGSPTTKFEKAVGFRGGVRSGSNKPIFNGDVYHNGVPYSAFPTKAVGLDWGHQWNANGNAIISRMGKYDNGVVANGPYLGDVTTGASSEQETTDSMHLMDTLNFKKAPPRLKFNEDLLDSVVHQVVTGTASYTPTGGDINDACDSAIKYGDTLCGGFAVVDVNVPNTSDEMIKGGDAIDRKVIICWNGQGVLPNFPECTSNANVILYSTVSNNMKRFGGFTYFRGILFVSGTGFQHQPGGGGATIDGATYYDTTAAHYINSSGGMHYKYNDSVLNEASCMGLITSADDSTAVIEQLVDERDTLVLKAGYSNIIPVLRARSF